MPRPLPPGVTNTAHDDTDILRIGLHSNPAHLPELQFAKKNAAGEELKLVSLLKSDIVMYEPGTERRIGVIKPSGQTLSLKVTKTQHKGPRGIIVVQTHYSDLVLPEDFDPDHTLYLLNSGKLNHLKGYALEHGGLAGHFGRPAEPVKDAAGSILGYSWLTQVVGDPLMLPSLVAAA